MISKHNTTQSVHYVYAIQEEYKSYKHDSTGPNVSPCPTAPPARRACLILEALTSH